MEERSLVGLEARAVDGSVVGRISEVLVDEDSEEVTHVVVEPDEGEQMEVPITAVTLDPEVDFATFEADRSDEEEYLVTEPLSPEETEEDLEAREDWEDESYTPDSGYPRNDAFVNPETGEEEVDPRLEDNEGLEDDVRDLIVDTGLEVRSAQDGVVELGGSATTQEDLEEVIADIMGLDEVREVDSSEVEVG